MTVCRFEEKKPYAESATRKQISLHSFQRMGPPEPLVLGKSGYVSPSEKKNLKNISNGRPKVATDAPVLAT